ncbi:MAG: class I SAM-dependent methyltransferase [Inconstantimicrobium porci]|uniref:SAM-dependent methyltransferase n=1 Tax=Inconstantimicrobium porci TaxID=2652291 RepID=UPI00240921DA|nr:class I SAM-dependent methyltransferase [Inconstantimicrobium porci]MDD6771056.1 class I SAM-dependent methyltransferase [Inconstantimicrobium porci]MDY5910660.1 class I SAM-dependent methyltransferase [Inconstantimicrobium porci]
MEIGCGRGESLKYHAEHKADELWGIDISEKQIEKAKILPVTFVIKARKLN